MKVIAHRGSSQLAPENTLPAIKKAICDRADAIEIDVQLTKDDKLVVIHDEWLNRTTNGKGFVIDSSYEYIRTLDAGSWFHRSFKGTKVPLLEDVLQLVRNKPVDLHIELKNNLIHYEGLENAVISTLQRHKMQDQVILSSFKEESLHKCYQLDPGIRLGFLCWKSLDLLRTSKTLNRLKLYSVHPHITLLEQDIKHLQVRGLNVFPYVIQRKKHLRQCMLRKVDGVFTNSPKRVKQLIVLYNSRR